MSKLTEQEQADVLWQRQIFYFNEPKLVSIQKIGLQIGEIVRVLRQYEIEDLDYWSEVKKIIYKK